MENQTKTPDPKPEVKAFGRTYVFQRTFTVDDAKDIGIELLNWKRAGHHTMLKKGGHLYVTQFKTRGY